MTDLYFCPTVREVESATSGGFDVCCAHPELHVPMPDNEATAAVSQALSDAAKREFALEQWLAEECRKTEALRAQVAAVRAYADSLYSADWKIDACGVREKLYELLPMAPVERGDVAGSAPRRFTAGDFLRSPKTGETPTLSRDFDADIELPELTAEDAVEAMEDMATDLYRAEDRLAFVREMCDLADREQRQVTTEQVRAWTRYEGCANATPDGAELARSLAFALAAILPDAEPVFCHHEHRTVRWRTSGGVTTMTATCKSCPARAESTEGEPELAPYLLNAERCTQACNERHTNGPGCLMAPDWSKPILGSEP